MHWNRSFLGTAFQYRKTQPCNQTMIPQTALYFISQQDCCNHLFTIYVHFNLYKQAGLNVCISALHLHKINNQYQMYLTQKVDPEISTPFDKEDLGVILLGMMSISYQIQFEITIDQLTYNTADFNAIIEKSEQIKFYIAMSKKASLVKLTIRKETKNQTIKFKGKQLRRILTKTLQVIFWLLFENISHQDFKQQR